EDDHSRGGDVRQVPRLEGEAERAWKVSRLPGEAEGGRGKGIAGFGDGGPREQEARLLRPGERLGPGGAGPRFGEAGHGPRVSVGEDVEEGESQAEARARGAAGAAAHAGRAARRIVGDPHPTPPDLG